MTRQVQAPPVVPPKLSALSKEDWLQRYHDVRRHSMAICEPLHPEDCMLQSMPDASPIRWHLAHTTWFFETFLLKRQSDYQPVSDQFESLFNSYYNSIGDPFPRDRRGLLSRPTVAEVFQYRKQVDERIESWLEKTSLSSEITGLLEIGLNHEQQHQELMLTDLKHAFSFNPLGPIYQHTAERTSSNESSTEPKWIEFADSKLAWIGADEDGFCFDNETPIHQTLVHPFAMATELVTCGQFMQFIEDGGYQRPEFWLSAGWAFIGKAGIDSPLYWRRRDGKWAHYTLRGIADVDPHQPVCHVSYFEADAYARYRGCKLPTEHQWEYAISQDNPSVHLKRDADRNFACEPPTNLNSENDLAFRFAFSSLWQWTSSDYNAYPGYQPPVGAIGEYNGKFMSGNYVLRGSSFATPPGHTRLTYRNFFAPTSRWQFTGIRLSKEIG